MKKWNAQISITIQAKTRHDAWKIAQDLIEKHFRGLGNVYSVTSEPVSDDWIAVNEPIMKRGKPEPLILTKRGQRLMPERKQDGYELER